MSSERHAIIFTKEQSGFDFWCFVIGGRSSTYKYNIKYILSRVTGDIRVEFIFWLIGLIKHVAI